MKYLHATDAILTIALKGLVISYLFFSQPILA